MESKRTISIASCRFLGLDNKLFPMSDPAFSLDNLSRALLCNTRQEKRADTALFDVHHGLKPTPFPERMRLAIPCTKPSGSTTSLPTSHRRDIPQASSFPSSGLPPTLSLSVMSKRLRLRSLGVEATGNLKTGSARSAYMVIA